MPHPAVAPREVATSERDKEGERKGREEKKEGKGLWWVSGRRAETPEKKKEATAEKR